MKKALALLLTLFLLPGVLAGCGQHTDPPEQGHSAGTKTLVFADTTFNPENGEPDINPHNDYAGWACIRYGVGETLFRYSDSMELEPWLAESYERPDELTWVITLREGISFTSGRSLDAQAVKECLDSLVAAHDRARGDLCLDRTEAQGQTLTLVTTTPKPALLNFLSDPYGCIVDIQAGVTPEGIVSGTGPYRAETLVSGQRLELVKNESYWNGTPSIDRITIRTITDGDTLTMALQAGEVDAAYGMPYVSYPLFENEDYTFTGAATSRAFFLWMNFDSPILQDPAVRRAIAMGVDKKGFVNTLLGGNGVPAAGVFPDSFVFGIGETAAPDYDPAGARQALEAAGWVDTDGDGIREKDGRPLSLRYVTYPSRQELPLLAESVQATLKELGIELSINCTASHSAVLADPEAWDLYASAMVTAPTGDPEYFFTTCALDSSVSNKGRYHSDALESLAAELAVTFGPEERGQLAAEMQQILLEDNAYVFCAFLRMNMIARAGVTGLQAHPCDYYEITAELDIA